MEQGNQEAKAAPKARSCGECSMCCFSHRIEEIPEKGKAEWCQHCKASSPGGFGCSVYDTRPPTCKGYSCLWLRGIGGELGRPDRLGVVLDLVIPEDVPMKIIVFWEVRSGALEQEKIRRVMEYFSNKGFCTYSRRLLPEGGYGDHFDIPEIKEIKKGDDKDK